MGCNSELNRLWREGALRASGSPAVAPIGARCDRTWELRRARVFCVLASIKSVLATWASSTVRGHLERRADLAHPLLAQAADAFDEQRHGH